jgi:2-(1,2-epoxy-1,2-dihydrophenyl)acetyl-CoA isomerase
MIGQADELRVEHRESTTWIILNRPSRLNAFTWQMRDQILLAIMAATEDANCRAVVIAAAGRGFCAGMDINLLANELSAPMRDRRKQLERTQQVIRGIANCPKPVIAAVQGIAVGAGWSFAMAADVVICAPGAELYQVFLTIGLIPDTGALYFLPRRVGRRVAHALMTRPRRVSSIEALKMGAIDEVVEADRLEARCEELATELALSGVDWNQAKRVFAQAGSAKRSADWCAIAATDPS